tara:strand:+ start:81 stop:380 length:300 start_codon:yes stop_codon:yes gene_type:complete
MGVKVYSSTYINPKKEIMNFKKTRRCGYDVCKVSEYKENKLSHNSKITIGDLDHNHILLQGGVIHDIVKSVMRGSDKIVKQEMIGHLERLIEIEDKENG